jgi:hypothetical protein
MHAWPQVLFGHAVGSATIGADPATSHRGLRDMLKLILLLLLTNLALGPAFVRIMRQLTDGGSNTWQDIVHSCVFAENSNVLSKLVCLSGPGRTEC